MGANAQTSVWTFTAGSVLTAAQMNDTARTGVPVFATTATRDAAFGGTGEKTLAEGQMCYIEAAPKRLQVYNGTAWVDYFAEWTSYTPTLTNMTQGNGTITARYTQLGKLVMVKFRFVFGSTSSMSTTPGISLPATADTTSTNAFSGNGWCLVEDSGTDSYQMSMALATSTRVNFYTVNVSGTYPSTQSITATVPMTWTTNDSLTALFFYEAA